MERVEVKVRDSCSSSERLSISLTVYETTHAPAFFDHAVRAAADKLQFLLPVGLYIVSISTSVGGRVFNLRLIGEEPKEHSSIGSLP